MKNWIAIINRRAGGLRSPQKHERIANKLRQFGAEVAFTERPGHAQELARRASGAEGIAVAGGDGTLLEVLNGAAGAAPRLAVIPTGRGNSLARDLGVFPVAHALECLHSSRVTRVDLIEVLFDDIGRARRRLLSASTVALGYPAAVVRSAGAHFRRLGGYCYAAAAVCLRPRPVAMRIAEETAAASRSSLTGLVVNNTRHLGNFLSLPHASCRDGSLDVMELRAGYWRQCAHNVSMLSGLQFYTPARLGRARSLALTLSEPHDLMVDGELFAGVVSLNVRIQPAAIEFVCGGVEA